MPWYKITLTEKQLSKRENESLVAAFLEVYHRCKSEVANMALFIVKGDNCIYFLNASAGASCDEIRKRYSAKVAQPAKNICRVAGEIGPQIYDS